MGARVRRFLIGLGGVLGVFLALLVSFLVHCSTELAKEAVRGVAETMASESSRGTLSIARVSELGLERITLEGYVMTAPSGLVVIDSPILSGTPVVGALFDGELRMRDCRFEDTTIRLTEGPGGQVDLVWASEVPDDRSAMLVVLDEIQLVNNTLVVDLPDKPRMRMTQVAGLAYLEIGHQFFWRMDRVHGQVGLPVLGERTFEDMSGRLKSDHAHPLIVDMVVDVAVAEPHVHLDYRVPALAGGEGDPHFDLDLPSGLGGSEDGHVTRASQRDADEDTDEDIDEETEERREDADEAAEERQEDADERQEAAEDAAEERAARESNR